MKNKFFDFINNKIEIDNLDKFAVIVGKNPSLNARSPVLWNAAFKANNLNFSMVPIDVDLENLEIVLSLLQEDNKCIGGAITIPYKTNVLNWLEENTSDEAKNIQAVNCIYRDKEGIFRGTNTDGEASLVAFKSKFGEFKKKKILIMGSGGAGKAVVEYFAKELNNSSLYLTSRNKSYFNSKKKPNNIIWVDWQEKSQILNTMDILINCTSLGFDSQTDITPLEDRDIRLLKKQSIVYDIIYNPEKTLLLNLAEKNELKIINGSEMNLLQAVLAFKYVVNTFDENINPEKAMRKIVKNK
jgi:shikimate dehydrogenase